MSATDVPGRPPVPEGHEVVVLPTEVVDAVADLTDDDPIGRVLIDACRAAVAARPAPEVERVPWYRAMGRRTKGGDLLGEIVQAYPSPDSPAGIYVEYELPEQDTTGNPQRGDVDGTVEVLRQDGDR